MSMMLRTQSLFALLLTTQFAPKVLGDDITPQVQGELKKMRADVSTELGKLKKRTVELSAQQERAIQESKKKAEIELSGAEILNNHRTLLGTRYCNEAGDPENGWEISTRDVESINKLFQRYLSWNPLSGRISLGEARRSLEWGVKRLKELAQLHNGPSKENHPELEIIALQLKKNEEAMKKLTSIANKLGIDPNAEFKESGDEGTRMPASQQKE